MMSKQMVKCKTCGTVYRVKTFQNEMYCKHCHENTHFMLLKQKEALFHSKPRTFHIRCKHCNTRFLIDHGQIPKQCPSCNDPWKHHKPIEDKNMIDFIYELIMPLDQDHFLHGYEKCDHLGWSVATDEELQYIRGHSGDGSLHTGDDPYSFF